MAGEMRRLKNRLPDVLMSSNEQKGIEYTNDFNRLRDQYAQWYLDLYRRSHINESQMLQKSRIENGNENTICKMVADAPFEQSARYDGWKRNMSLLQPADPQVTLDSIKRTPYRGFNPLEAPVLPDLNQLAEEIKEIFDSFVTAFQDILEDPAIKKNISILEPEQQSIVNRFISGEVHLDAMYAPQLKNIISALYNGLTAVEITSSDLVNSFSRAMSVDDAKSAFNQLITRLSAGKNNPRIIIKLS